MPKPDIQKTFCTTREAAGLLGVSVGCVQLWVESGLLQAWKTAGGHRRVMRDSVDHLLHKNSPLAGPGGVPAARNVAPRRLKVLVVEDDASLLHLYQMTMSRWPMSPEITVASDGWAALMHIGKSAPDLLVTDLHMPGMDGFQMLRALRKAPEPADTTIVAVTALDAAEIGRRGGIEAGVEVLPKPIPFARLLDIATDIVNRARFQLVPRAP